MKLELTRPIVFFDLETTGLDVESDRIVELAAVKLWPDGQREEKVRRFNPLVPIPQEATAVHGITDEMVRDEPPFKKRAKSVHDYFAGCDLGGFNVVEFDVPLLRAELERAGHPLDLAGIDIVDAYRIFAQRERHDLGTAVRFYCGQEHVRSHQALGDVTATVEVLAAQLERYPDLPRTPAAIDASLRPPDAVDRLGKLRWHNGEVAVAFGKHKGRSLRYLAKEEPDYLRWMIERRVAPDATGHLRDALLGIFAAKP